ncbi:uncharacterized protein VP01_2727g2 [Puccinia sorghi]|uniref:Uncharacterized protein n=1 Tax=Puccinia sorghi TaxID=27349 RepID=A0A0L6V399_9BASI|nr:uncharacterized protein VP01_2727g2 [Puccinia sorghi]
MPTKSASIRAAAEDFAEVFSNHQICPASVQQSKGYQYSLPQVSVGIQHPLNLLTSQSPTRPGSSIAPFHINSLPELENTFPSVSSDTLLYSLVGDDTACWLSISKRDSSRRQWECSQLLMWPHLHSKESKGKLEPFSAYHRQGSVTTVLPGSPIGIKNTTSLDIALHIPVTSEYETSVWPSSNRNQTPMPIVLFVKIQMMKHNHSQKSLQGSTLLACVPWQITLTLPLQENFARQPSKWRSTSVIPQPDLQLLRKPNQSSILNEILPQHHARLPSLPTYSPLTIQKSPLKTYEVVSSAPFCKGLTDEELAGLPGISASNPPKSVYVSSPNASKFSADIGRAQLDRDFPLSSHKTINDCQDVRLPSTSRNTSHSHFEEWQYINGLVSRLTSLEPDLVLRGNCLEACKIHSPKISCSFNQNSIDIFARQTIQWSMQAEGCLPKLMDLSYIQNSDQIDNLIKPYECLLPAGSPRVQLTPPFALLKVCRLNKQLIELRQLDTQSIDAGLTRAFLREEKFVEKHPFDSSSLSSAPIKSKSSCSSHLIPLQEATARLRLRQLQISRAMSISPTLADKLSNNKWRSTFTCQITLQRLSKPLTTRRSLYKKKVCYLFLYGRGCNQAKSIHQTNWIHRDFKATIQMHPLDHTNCQRISSDSQPSNHSGLPEELDDQDVIMIQIYFPMCKGYTQKTAMSDNPWRLSLGKYLQLCFYSPGLVLNHVYGAPRGGWFSCSHCIEIIFASLTKMREEEYDIVLKRSEAFFSTVQTVLLMSLDRGSCLAVGKLLVRPSCIKIYYPKYHQPNSSKMAIAPERHRKISAGPTHHQPSHAWYPISVLWQRAKYVPVGTTLKVVLSQIPIRPEWMISAWLSSTPLGTKVSQKFVPLFKYSDQLLRILQEAVGIANAKDVA